MNAERNLRFVDKPFPSVSVIVPVYNHASFVAEAVGSVIAQTFPALEIIAIDDGSTDESGRLLRELAANEPRMQVHWQSNRGSAAAINRGISLAKGNWIALLNSDDRWHPKRLEKLLRLADRNRANFCLSATRPMDRHGSIIRDSKHPWVAMYRSIIATLNEYGPRDAFCLANPAVSTSNFIFSVDLYRTVGAFRNFRFIPDWDWALRASFTDTCQIAWEKSVLLDYRLHDSNTISQSGLRSSVEILRMLSDRQKASTDRARYIEQARNFYWRDVRAHVRRVGFAKGLSASDQAHLEERVTASTVIEQLERERDEARAHAEASQRQRDQDLAHMQRALEQAAEQRDQDLAHMREALERSDAQRATDLAQLRDAYEAQIAQLHDTISQERDVAAASREQLERERDEARAHAKATSDLRDHDLAEMQSVFQRAIEQRDLEHTQIRESFSTKLSSTESEVARLNDLINQMTEKHRIELANVETALELERSAGKLRLEMSKKALDELRATLEMRYLAQATSFVRQKDQLDGSFNELKSDLASEIQARETEISRLREELEFERKRWIGPRLRRAFWLK